MTAQGTREAKEGNKETKEAGAAKQQPIEQQQAGGAKQQAGGERGLVRRGREGGLLGRRATSWLGFPDLSFALASPFEMMRRMMEDFGTLGGISTWAPSVDVFERGGQLVVRADLPGMKRDDIRVELMDDGLLIEGERREEEEYEAGGLWRSERRYGSFRRLIPLPEDIDRENVSASFRDGVLEVAMGMPQQEKAKGRRIEVTEGEAPTAGKVKH
jgi:HSP20 family protein